jgi:hypothetical protein
VTPRIRARDLCARSVVALRPVQLDALPDELLADELLPEEDEGVLDDELSLLLPLSAFDSLAAGLASPPLLFLALP